MRASLHFCTATQRTNAAGNGVGADPMRTATREEGRPRRKRRPLRKTRRTRRPSTAQDPTPDVDMHIPATVLHIILLMTPRLPNCRRGMRPSWPQIASSRYPLPPYRGVSVYEALVFRDDSGHLEGKHADPRVYTCFTDPLRYRLDAVSCHPHRDAQFTNPLLAPLGACPSAQRKKDPIIAGTMGPCFAFAAELCERRLTWRSSRGRPPSCGRSRSAGACAGGCSWA